MNIDKSLFAHCMFFTATLANSRHASLHPILSARRILRKEGKVLQLQKNVQARQVSPCFESFQTRPCKGGFWCQKISHVVKSGADSSS